MLLRTVSGRNEFPDVKGIDTRFLCSLQSAHLSRNEFPDVKGIDTKLSLTSSSQPHSDRRNEFPDVKGIDTILCIEI